MTQPDDEQTIQSTIASLRLELISLQNSEDTIKQRIAEIDQRIRSVLEENSVAEPIESDNRNEQQVS